MKCKPLGMLDFDLLNAELIELAPVEICNVKS